MCSKNNLLTPYFITCMKCFSVLSEIIGAVCNFLCMSRNSYRLLHNKYQRKLKQFSLI